MFEEIKEEDRKVIREILAKFREPKAEVDYFYNLCFCICAPQAPFAKNLTVIKQLKDRDFFVKDIVLDELREIVRPVRFLRKAEYLILAKFTWNKIYPMVAGACLAADKRDWLVKHVKGLGMKTASHYLRNIGATDLAIVDTHVLKFLGVSSPKSTSEYIKIEQMFRAEASKRSLNLAELDAYVWKVFSGTDWKDFVY